jgi:non-ribosomal peptide synthetase component E (peptide arylation enzyme)
VSEREQAAEHGGGDPVGGEMKSYWSEPAAEPVREDTVGALPRAAAEAAADTVALVEGVADPTARRRWRYADLLAEAEQVARALLGRFAPGERIAVWANNIPEWVVLELAAALAGLTLVTVNPAPRGGEIRLCSGSPGRSVSSWCASIAAMPCWRRRTMSGATCRPCAR